MLARHGGHHEITLGVVLACGLAWIPASAQTVGASLQGTVHDPSGDVLRRAEVEIRNVETGATRMVAADEAGRWREPILYSENFHERDAAIRISGGDVQSAEPSEFQRPERADSFRERHHYCA